jgi:hypothetical protein
MSFSNIASAVNAMETGYTWRQHYFKTAPPAVQAGRWIDCSVSAGTPSYNTYLGDPLTFVPATGTNNKYIYTGPTPQAGQQKFLASWQMVHAAANPVSYMLVDLLGYYSSIDGDSTDPQIFDNTASLPRYTSGEGVQIWGIGTAPMSASALMTVNYTNDAGQAKSINTRITNTNAIGTGILTSGSALSANAASPFTQLSSGDKGVRYIESIQLDAAAGGLFALMLVKPLAWLQCNGSGVATEKVFITQQGCLLPEVVQGAALTVFGLPTNTTVLANVVGEFNFIWG